MPNDVRILGAARSYEFKPDGIALASICARSVGQMINSAFQFSMGGIAGPPATFGPVPDTTPPGAVFQEGTMEGDSSATPIDCLHVEARRIVIRVVGESSRIDGCYNKLVGLLGDVATGGGGPVLSTPDNVLNYSELSVRLSFRAVRLVAPRFRTAVREASKEAAKAKIEFFPLVGGMVDVPNAEYPGDLSPGPWQRWVLAPRQGTKMSERTFFSAAPLDTQQHLRYLDRLEQAWK